MASGGARKGAGRKKMPDHKKKKGHNLYLTDSYYKKLLSITTGNNISKRVEELIDLVYLKTL